MEVHKSNEETAEHSSEHSTDDEDSKKDVSFTQHSDVEQNLTRFTAKIINTTQREDGLSSYTVYEVSVVRSVPNKADEKFEIARRFSEFYTFRKLAKASITGVIFPPFPEKEYFDKNSLSVIEQRKKMLQIFLDRLTAHSVLSQHPLTNPFLTATNSVLEVEFSKRKVPAKTTRSTQQGGLKGFFSSFAKKVSSITRSRPKPNKTDEDMQTLKTYSESLRNGFNNVRSYIEEAREEMDIQKQTFASLSKSGHQLAEFVKHHSAPKFSLSLVEISNALETSSTFNSNLFSIADGNSLAESFYMYQLLAEEAIQMLERRTKNAQAHHELLAESDGLKERIEKLRRGDPGNQEIDKNQRKQYEISQMIEASQQAVKIETESCMSETQKFRKEINEQIPKILSEYVEKKITDAKELVRCWENVQKNISNSSDA